jgi:hypothetical protein
VNGFEPDEVCEDEWLEDEGVRVGVCNAEILCLTDCSGGGDGGRCELAAGTGEFSSLSTSSSL